MSGSYADVPGHRMVLDLDGTQVYRISAGNVLTQYTPTQVTSLNSEGNSSSVLVCGQNDSGKLAILFPELRDLAGVFVNASDIDGGGTRWGHGSMTLFETSVNTTNGIDGTWVTQAMTYVDVNTSPAYRTDIVALAVPTIIAVRISFHSTAPSPGCNPIVHLYGSVSAGENPNRLALWHPTLDQEVGAAYFDWGDTARSSSEDRTFRLKNLSTTLDANTVTCSLDALTDTAPSVPAQYTLSTDGLSFTPTIIIASVLASAISSVLTVHRATPFDAVLSVWAARLSAEAEAWVLAGS